MLNKFSTVPEMSLYLACKQVAEDINIPHTCSSLGEHEACSKCVCEAAIDITDRIYKHKLPTGECDGKAENN